VGTGDGWAEGSTVGSEDGPADGTGDGNDVGLQSILSSGPLHSVGQQGGQLMSVGKGKVSQSGRPKSVHSGGRFMSSTLKQASGHSSIKYVHAVGTGDGAGDGAGEGNCEGSDEGNGDGNAVGKGDGPGEGSTEGSCDGSRDV
jgi:hypothetical protein